MQTYLSGPMTGLPDFNYPQFEEVKQQLMKLGLDVRSPHEIDAENPQKDCNDNGCELNECVACNPREWDWYMRHALRMELDCERIVFLPGWSKSRGARREFDLACDLGMEMYMAVLIPLDESGKYRVMLQQF